MDKTIFSHIFENMSSNTKTTENSFFAGKPKKGAFLIALVITLIVGFITFYITLFPLNIFNPGSVIVFIILLGLFTMLYVALSAAFNKLAKAVLTIIGLLALYLAVGFVISMPIFHASSLQSQLLLDQNADFYQDNPTISYESIPVVDHDSAMRLGDRQMGQIVEYVSQFEVDSTYNQINQNGKPVRVTELGYSDLIKWWNNRSNGLPAYIEVDMVTQDAQVVRLAEGMKYSKSEPLNRNIDRHVRFQYPTLMLFDASFEVDDSGVPYYISSSYEYKVGLFSGQDVTGAVLTNAITGESVYYPLTEIPTWVDRVYPSSLVTTQLGNWGQYINGFWNSVFSQVGVLKPTEGYNYIALDDDVYYYTGLTSVSQDASNVGFALINLRTKESKYYNIAGAEEFSAMSSAEGQVQHLGYTSTFPILINAQGTPSYFMSLKDSAGLVKQYAYVSVEDYQIVATGASVSEAEENYYQLLKERGKEIEDNTEYQTLTGEIETVEEAVKGGNSTYYFRIVGDATVYVADISLSDKLPLMDAGSTVSFEYVKNGDDVEMISKITIE